MTRGRWVAAALAAAVLLVGARMVASAVVEYRWYAAFGDGAAALWRVRAVALGVLRGTAAIAGAAYVYANLLGVVSTVDTVVLPRRVGGLDIVERVPAARLRWACGLVALALGALLALPLDGWTAVDALITRRSLGEIEPYTGDDLAFFVHWLPLENALYAWALLLLVVTGALVLGLYALTPGLRWSGGRPRLSGRVRRHVTLFGAGVLLLLAWGHRLDGYALLTAGSGEAGAFTGVDQLGAMPARFALGVLTALAALVLLRAGWMGQARVAFWTVSAVVVGALLVRALAPALTARLADPRTLADADAAAAANRALYTQRAFAVDRVRPAPAGYALTPAAIAAGAVSSWDAPALVRAATAARRTRAAAPLGFQPAGNGLAAVLLDYTPASVADALAAGAANPVDAAEYSVVVLDAARADEQGRPVALDGAALADAGRRVRLRVYPGASGRLLVAAGGVPGAPDRGVVGDPLDDWRVRVAHALAGRDLRLAFASPDGPAVRAVDRRDVRARVDALAPFFAQGSAVTPLLAADSVWFAVALYSASDAYPLAQRYSVAGGDWSAFRHAATALVNAQSGGVRLVPAPELDADARAWVRRFPRLFTPASSLPGELARALPPATDGALVQIEALSRFGARGERPPMLRRVQPPDNSDSAFAGTGRPPLALPAPPDSAAGPGVAAPAVAGWTLPLLSSADRVEGVIVALGGASPRTWWLPADAATRRWQELLDVLETTDGTAAVDAAGLPGDSAARTAPLGAAPLGAAPLGAAPLGTAPVGTAPSAPAAPRVDELGRLRVLPVGDGALAYVRPEYRIVAPGVPTLARTVALVGDTVRAGATSIAALSAGTLSAAPDGALDDPDRLARARRFFLDSRAALRRGDWAAVGRALEALGAALGAPQPAPGAP